MHLLMNNAEVRAHRVSCPPPDALEGTCQLFSIPFRHEKRAGVFAVHPPLLGKRIVIKSFKVDRQAEGGLYSQLAAELRLLERLLWVSGADVTLEEAASVPGSRPDQSHEPAYWDVALLVFPDQAVPGRIEPLAIHSWWHRSFKSWRLAGCLALGGGVAGHGFKRTATMHMAGELKEWLSRALYEIAAPAVLLSVPMVDGYVEQFLDALSLTICQGVLGYFRKSLMAPLTREILRRAGGAEGSGFAAQKTQTRQAEPALAAPADSCEVPVLKPPTRPGEPAAPAPQQQPAVGSGEILASTTPVEVSGPPVSPPLPVEPKSMDEAVLPDERPVPSPETQRPSMPTPPQRRDSASPLTQQAYARQAHGQPTSGEAVGPGPRPKAALQSKDDRQAQQTAAPLRPYGYSGTAPALPKQPQPVGRRTDEEMERLRRLLLESPELAVKRAEEVLTKKGIKPTNEIVEEYLQYLRRMLLQSEGEGGEPGNR